MISRMDTRFLALLCVLLVQPASPLPTPTTARKLVEVAPAKAFMLMKTWQTRADNQNLLKTVPDGKTGKKLKVVSAVAGEEASRRALCKKQFQLFRERAFSLASADSGDYPEAQRQLISELKIAGAARGLNAKLFATVGQGASTLSIVEALDREWNVLSLCVSPDARELPGIIAAEAATLNELRNLCADDGATLRVLPEVEASLAGCRESLGLAAIGDGPDAWLCCADGGRDGGGATDADGEAADEIATNIADGMTDVAERPAAAAAIVHNALRSRRTINSFATELPDGWEAALRRAVEAATSAPNHKRTEPWRFHLLGRKAIRRVCELNAELVTAKKGEQAGAKKLERWLAMPGWLVVTCVRSSDAPSMEDPAGVTRENYAACCCAVQNLCLALHAENIGTKWTSGPVNFDRQFGEAAGLAADEYVVGTIWFGEAAGELPAPPQKRLAVDDVLRMHD